MEPRDQSRQGCGSRGAGQTAQNGVGALSCQSGFTLIEMVVVLALLALITAIIVPVYGNSIMAMKARGACGDFVAELLFAQELSVREAREVRLYLNERERTYWLEFWISGFGEEKVFEVRSDGPGSGVHHVPESVKLTQIRARSGIGRGLYYITCFPNGACDRSSLRMEEDGETARGSTISTTGVLGGVKVSR